MVLLQLCVFVMKILHDDFIGFESKNNGREEGIRTLEGLHLTRVPGVLLQPLGHLSKFGFWLMLRVNCDFVRI